ncbi:hypothetical protein Y032_0003g1181 [Ancylostoma ceylanicum]|uniref:Uncharacterized protein n=1 Tax=Ancylostoma ceylanicum TaxID=53326 RepID=A0A016VXD8_9BILA|nr:hypothetical protein Y032_0003g1181 [Ancylostoma ceylanicum]
MRTQPVEHIVANVLTSSAIQTSVRQSPKILGLFRTIPPLDMDPASFKTPERGKISSTKVFVSAVFESLDVCKLKATLMEIFVLEISKNFEVFRDDKLTGSDETA